MDIASQLAHASILAIGSVVYNDTGGLNDTGVMSNSTNNTDWTGGEIVNNGSVVSPVDGTVIDEGSYILNTIIGLLIVLIASLLNALGLNLTKLDHIRQQSIPRRERRREIFRILWLAGMGTYIASQVCNRLTPRTPLPSPGLGRTARLVLTNLQLSLRPLAPVTATDINGTAVIVFGVILILIFSSINHGLSQSIDIQTLNGLWGRTSWLAYFALLVAFTGSTYFVSHLLASLLASRASYSPLPEETPSRRAWSFTVLERRALTRVENLFQRTDDARIVWLQGIGWAVCGGSLAGLCLVFTKVIVKLFVLPGHPLVHPSAILTLLLVILTAVLQIVCLNRALECTDTVVVVPLFYAGYTVFGFINSLIFFDQSKQYARWVLFAVFISIGVLISGVILLSLKSSAKAASDPYTVTAESTEIRLRPRVPRAASRDKDAQETDEAPTNDVMWEVGSVSDSESKDGESERRGVGSQTGRGERRGLLGEEEDDDGSRV